MGTRTADITKFIEDGEVEGHAVVIDSSDRDREKYPDASSFRTIFDDPYYNVVSVEILDAYVPKMNVDTETEKITFNEFEFEYIGYDVDNFITAFNNEITSCQIKKNSLSTKFIFESQGSFTIDATNMSNTELDRFGIKKKVHTSQLIGNVHKIEGELFFNFTPDIYINVSCDEIDSMVNRGKMNKQTMSFGRITLGGDRTTTSVNQDFDNMSFPPRYFHPIAKLPALTFSFRKKNGDLYNFQGLNHVITLVIRCIVVKDHILPQTHNTTTIAENVTKHIDNTKKLKIDKQMKNKIKRDKQFVKQSTQNDKLVLGTAFFVSLITFYTSFFR